jgi:hypothetical protein
LPTIEPLGAACSAESRQCPDGPSPARLVNEISSTKVPNSLDRLD